MFGFYRIVFLDHSRKESKKIEISTVDPIASMQPIQNRILKDVAEQVSKKLKQVIDLV